MSLFKKGLGGYTPQKMNYGRFSRKAALSLFSKSMRATNAKGYRKKGRYGKIVGPRKTSLMVGFPRSKIVRMRHAEYITFDNGISGVPSIIAVSANDINKVYPASVSQRPLSYDQWKTFYNHWTVIGAKIKFVMSGEGNTANAGYIVGIKLNDSPTLTTTDTRVLMEQGKCKYTYQQSITNSNLTSVTETFSAKKWFGYKDIKDVQEEAGTAFSNALSPSRQAYFIVFAGNVDPTVDPGKIGGYVTIDYIVMLTEPNELPAQSTN